jgi:hypothetical protein
MVAQMKYIELVKLADVVLRDKFSWKRFIDGTPLVNDLPFYMADFARAAMAQEREACLKIIREYQIPVGSSSAGEIACEMTYGALKDIHDEIKARGTT